MPNQPKTPVRGVRLPNIIWEALQREATNKKQTPSELIRDVLSRHVKRNTTVNEDDILIENDADPTGLAEAFVGTCDSGNCDLLTSAVVWVEDESGAWGAGRWLSMCYGHAIKQLAAPFLPEY